MVSNTQILSVSVPKALCEFIEKAELSASAIIQEAIMEKKQLWDTINTDVIKLQRAKEVMQGLITELTTYIEEKGLSEEWIKWRGEKQQSHNMNNAIL